MGRTRFAKLVAQLRKNVFQAEDNVYKVNVDLVLRIRKLLLSPDLTSDTLDTEQLTYAANAAINVLGARNRLVESYEVSKIWQGLARAMEMQQTCTVVLRTCSETLKRA